MKTIDDYTQEEREEIIGSLQGNYDHYEQQIVKLNRLLAQVQEDINQFQQWRHEVITEGKLFGVDFTD